MSRPLRSGADEEELQALYRRGPALKPSSHRLEQYQEHQRLMNQIGLAAMNLPT